MTERMSTREVLDALGCSDTTLRRYRREEGFPTPRRRTSAPNSAQFYDRAEVEAWIEGRDLALLAPKRADDETLSDAAA